MQHKFWKWHISCLYTCLAIVSEVVYISLDSDYDLSPTRNHESYFFIQSGSCSFFQLRLYFIFLKCPTFKPDHACFTGVHNMLGFVSKDKRVCFLLSSLDSIMSWVLHTEQCSLKTVIGFYWHDLSQVVMNPPIRCPKQLKRSMTLP